MQDHKALRAAELLRRHCRERCCDDCIFWGREFPQCRLTGIRSPGHFPVEEIRADRQRADAAKTQQSDPGINHTTRAHRDVSAFFTIKEE